MGKKSRKITKLAPYRPIPPYTRNWTIFSFIILAVSACLQIKLGADGLFSDLGAPQLLLVLVFLMPISLSHFAAGFVFKEMLKEGSDYVPRFNRSYALQGLMVAGICSTFVLQMLVYFGSTMVVAQQPHLVLSLTTSFLPLVVISHAGAYVLVNNLPHHPYYTLKYGYQKQSDSNGLRG